jgi:hypothetical protein
MMHGYARPYVMCPHSPATVAVGATVGRRVGRNVGVAVGASVVAEGTHSPHCKGHTLADVGLPHITASVSASSPRQTESTGPHGGRAVGATVGCRVGTCVLGGLAGADVVGGPAHSPHSIGHPDANAGQKVVAFCAAHAAVSGPAHAGRPVVGAPDGEDEGAAEGDAVGGADGAVELTGAAVGADGANVGAATGAAVGA